MYFPNLIPEDLLKILLIVLLSGIIGYNREKSGMLVGIRTHILVGLSAVLLQIIAIKFSDIPSFSGDPARLGGQMLTGIGFLGAGSILKDNKNIRGLTTAASIFFVACIGLAVGFGYYELSLLVTLIGYAFLSDVLKLKKYINKKRTNTLNFLVSYEENIHVDVRDIISILSHIYVEVDSIDLKKEENHTSVILKLKSDDEISPTEIVAELSQLKYIRTIKQI